MERQGEYQKYETPPERAETGVLLCVEPGVLPCFYPLFQRGFPVEAVTGCTVGDFLYRQIGLSVEFVEANIKTLFLNGKPVDDFDSAVIPDGSTLALSAAMPGLVGATMRRGGHYATMRSGITHRKGESCAKSEKGTITIKLFNILMKELGPVFLARGILVRPDDFEDLVRTLPPDFQAGCRASAEMDGRSVAVHELKAANWPQKRSPLRLRVLVDRST